MTGSVTGSSHPQVSYQVASKQELEVIYEPVAASTSKTIWLLLAGLVLLLCLAGGTGVALWQSGLLGGQTSHLNTTTSSSSSSSTTSLSSSSSSATTSLAESGGSVVDLSGRQRTTTTTVTTILSNDLILDTRRDKQLMLLPGNPGTILGHWRRKKHETTCSGLEGCPHKFLKYLGSAYLPGIDGVVTCGYEENQRTGQREQICYVFYRAWEQWTRIFLFPDRVMFDGAAVAWQDKLVVFGGYHLLYNKKSVTRAIWVFQFNSVRDYFGGDTTAVEGSGSYEGENSDDEDLYSEGEGSGEEEVSVRVHVVEDSDQVLAEYGPSAAESCAVSLETTWQNVVFVATGGLNNAGLTLDTVMRLQLSYNNGREPRLASPTSRLPSLRLARRRHGCTKTDLDGESVIVIAGGLDGRNNAVSEVEILNIENGKKWRTLGQLNHPVQNFPTIGRVLGQLAVVGGWRQYESAGGDVLNLDNQDSREVISTEVYDEEKSVFRVASPSDKMESLPNADYQYYGVMFPKHWCKMY